MNLIDIILNHSNSMGLKSRHEQKIYNDNDE